VAAKVTKPNSFFYRKLVLRLSADAKLAGRFLFHNAVGSKKNIPSFDRWSFVLRSGIVEKGDRNARIIDKPRIIEVTSFISCPSA
jgi:hypothetical protein